MTGWTDDSSEQEDKPKTNNRLSLANRTHMKRKFPKPPDYDCRKHELLKIDSNPSGNEEGNGEQRPVACLPAVDNKKACSSGKENSARKRVSCPTTRQRKPKPPIRRIVCQGRELFELGQNGWTETLKNMWENKSCEALALCRKSINDTHVSKDAVLNPAKPYVSPTFPDSSSDDESQQAKKAPHSLPMTTMASVLKRMVVKGFHGPTLDEWVTVTIDKLEGLGSPDVTYIGCAKQVVGLPGRSPFPCRKRVGNGDSNPDEVLNHKYRHSGACSLPSSGVHFYAMAAMISDDSGFTTAQLFAPGRHVLGMPPTAFVKLSESRKAEVLLLAVLGKTFRLQLMTCWTREDGKIIKILFVDPISLVPRVPTRLKDDPDVYHFAESIGSLEVSARWTLLHPTQNSG